MTKLSRGRVNVAHVSSAHPYTDNRIHYRECQTLAAAGYDVSLIAVDSKVIGPESDVYVVKIPNRARLRRLSLSSIQSIYCAFKSRAKIVHLHDPELILFIPILRLGGRYVIYDAHEDLPMQVLTKPYLTPASGRAMKVPAHLLVKIAGMTANRIVAATSPVAARYKSGKTVVVHNYPPLRTEESDPPKKEDILVYVGAISESRGIIEMLDSLGDRDFPANWTLHLAGRAGPSALKAIEDKASTGRVVYHGELPPHSARDLMLRAKVGIVALANTPGHREALPTKMFEYFASSLPVIASDFPVWREILEESDTGILVDETDSSAIARAVRVYAESPELLKKHAGNARRYAVEVRNWTTEGAKLVGIYDDLISP